MLELLEGRLLFSHELLSILPFLNGSCSLGICLFQFIILNFCLLSSSLFVDLDLLSSVNYLTVKQNIIRYFIVVSSFSRLVETSIRILVTIMISLRHSPVVVCLLLGLWT